MNMAFFDQMKNKLTATSQSAVQMAKDLTETTRLNGQVNEAEKEINELYRKLGFEVYQAYREEPIPAGAELIAQLNELHEKVEALKAQIQTINKASLCPACGAKISKGMVFCSSCGCRLPEAEEKQVVLCANCGGVLEEDALFCTNCGTRVETKE